MTTPAPQPIGLTVSRVAQAVANANGVATASIVNDSPGQVWTITLTSVQCTSVSITTATTYKGLVAAPGNVIESAYLSGNSDSSDTVITLRPGDNFLCVWTGSDAGARGTVTITGSAQ